MDMLGEVVFWTVCEVGVAGALAYWLRPIVGEMIERGEVSAPERFEMRSEDAEPSGER